MAIKNFTTKDYKQFKNGDVKALRKIYNLLKHQLTYFLRGYISDEENIKEVIQDVFVKLWENRKKIKSEDTLLNYIYSISKNHVIDLLRKRRVNLVELSNINESELGNSYNACDYIEYEELEENINISINKLSKRKKEVFLLSRINNLTYPQISSKLNISISAVEKNISSAIKELRSNIYLLQK